MKRLFSKEAKDKREEARIDSLKVIANHQEQIQSLEKRIVVLQRQVDEQTKNALEMKKRGEKMSTCFALFVPPAC